MTDNINHPEHYKSGGMEAIDVIEAFSLGFHLGNAVKYILRAGRKTADARDDIKKAVWYLDRYYETQEANMLGELQEIADIEKMNFIAWYRDATVEEIAVARRNNAAKLDELTRKYEAEINLMEIIMPPRRDTGRHAPFG